MLRIITHQQVATAKQDARRIWDDFVKVYDEMMKVNYSVVAW
jgi:hypothetical protein